MNDQAERFHPGEYVADEIAARGWSLETFCARSGLQRHFAEELLAKQARVTWLVARCLARAFGVDASTWLRLQKAYDGEEVKP